MKRRLLAILTLVSLLACVVCLVLWLRSGFVLDQFGSANGSRTFTISSGVGLLRFDRTTYNPPTTPSEGRWALTGQVWLGKPWPVFNWQWLPSTDLTTKTFSSGMVITRRQTAIPYWIPTLITSVLPAMSVRRWLAHRLQTRRRRKAGLCPTCGYDLRASKERCPECGEGVPAQAVSGQA